jgi:hypothetical protein
MQTPVLPQSGLFLPTLPESPPGLAPASPIEPNVEVQPQAGAPADAAVVPQVQASPAPQAVDAGVGTQVEQGRVLFDESKPAVSADAVEAGPDSSGVSLDDVVRRTASRKLDGVFIQQEQEGSLIAADPRDSSGDIFRYYRPIEMRPQLVSAVQQSLTGFEKAGYGLRRAFNFWDKKDLGKVWNALPVSAKLKYLGKLEAAVLSEKGESGAWRGKVSLLLERRPEAPDFLTLNPHMESPPAGYEGQPGAHFLQPEIVSDEDHPAATVNEALARSRRIIAETGHAGTQYHVFIKAPAKVILRGMESLQSALQLVNNVLFARAASESLQNVEHASLLPWHRGRSQRVAELVSAAAAQPHTPAAEDPDSEKHSFVGLRYWGTEGGNIVLSFELRGAAIPWKQSKRAVRDLDSVSRPERDYTAVQYYLTFLSLYAQRLSQGRAPAIKETPIDLDASRADELIRARAQERAIPADAYFGVEEFGKSLSGTAAVPPGYLFPFAASDPSSPSLRRFIDGYLEQSARVRSLSRGGGGIEYQRRNIQYMFWGEYGQWARGYENSARPRFEALFRQAAAGG